MATVILKFPTAQLEQRLNNAVKTITGAPKQRVLLAMAKKFAQITRANFGAKGVNRPAPWPPLVTKYARWKRRRTGSNLADLILTGRMLRSIRAECRSSDYSTVTVSTPYAAAHQFGSSHNRLPARPFMPFDASGRPTQFVTNEVMAVAEKELNTLLRQV